MCDYVCKYNIVNSDSLKSGTTRIVVYICINVYDLSWRICSDKNKKLMSIYETRLVLVLGVGTYSGGA